MWAYVGVCQHARDLIAEVVVLWVWQQWQELWPGWGWGWGGVQDGKGQQCHLLPYGYFNSCTSVCVPPRYYRLWLVQNQVCVVLAGSADDDLQWRSEELNCSDWHAPSVHMPHLAYTSVGMCKRHDNMT
jgi:hypothetical protein